MGAVCDVYDAITSNRPYKTGWDPAESIKRMAEWKGHFDRRSSKPLLKASVFIDWLICPPRVWKTRGRHQNKVSNLCLSPS